MSDQVFGIDDVWAIAEAHNDERPLFIRYRSGLQTLVGDPRLPNRLTISWPFEPSPETAGLPPAPLGAEMADFENALCAALEPPELAVLTSVWTTTGLREWVWYGGAKEELASSINRALTGRRVLPLQLLIQPDAEWEQHRDLLASVD